MEVTQASLANYCFFESYLVYLKEVHLIKCLLDFYNMSQLSQGLSGHTCLPEQRNDLFESLLESKNLIFKSLIRKTF